MYSIIYTYLLHYTVTVLYYFYIKKILKILINVRSLQSEIYGKWNFIDNLSLLIWFQCNLNIIITNTYSSQQKVPEG